MKIRLVKLVRAEKPVEVATRYILVPVKVKKPKVRLVRLVNVYTF